MAKEVAHQALGSLRVSRLPLFLYVPALLLLLLFVQGTVAAPRTEPNSAPALTATPTPAPTCLPAWNLVYGGPGVFESVATLASNNAWAVGYQGVLGGGRWYDQTLVEHWTGSVWSMVSSPNAVQDPNYLLSVSAVSASDIWAAGYYYSGAPTNTNFLTLVEHWDGAAWTIVPSPNVVGWGNYLLSIAAASANDVWAVGADTTVSSQRGLILHWNGNQWSIIANPAGADSELDGVTALSANNAWAVGFQANGSLHQMLIEHWDGSQWSSIPAPETGSTTRLRKVSGSGPNDVWAVGEVSGVNYRTLILHWDGCQWSVVPSPNPSAGSNRLSGVVALSPTNAWAVGDYRYEYPTPGMGTRTLIEHWDGSQWSVVPSPNSSHEGATHANYLTDLATSGALNLWAIGESYDGVPTIERWTLPLQYTGACLPTVTATSTVTPTPLTNTPTVTRTFTSTPTHTPTPTPTATYTPTPTISPTPTNTYTPSPIPTPTDLPPTSGIPCQVWLINMISQCATSSTYNYSIDFTGQNPYVGMAPFTVHFEIAPNPGGPWIEIDHQDVNFSCYSYPCTYNGTFNETGILFRYGWYRLWTNIHYICPPLDYDTYGETLPTYLCFPTPTGTTEPQPTALPCGSVSPTPTACAVSFTDVHPVDYFGPPVLYLACHGVISGYADGTFRPYSQTTRAQMVKIVVLGFALPIQTPAGGYTFADVPPSQPFFAYVETAAARQIVGGYGCGGPGEPCDVQHRPYFRPYANVTRGQLSKIAALAAGWPLLNPASATFADVLPGTAFYEFAETAYCHGIISGYACGGPGEPCDAQRRPYFRSATDGTRGQIAKIVYLALINPPGICHSP